MSIRKHYWTRTDLDNNNISVEWDSNNQPIIIQDLPKTTGKWKRVRTQYTLIKEHPYGNDYSAVVVVLKMYGKVRTVSVSNIVWVFYNGSIGDYDIDHIDNDTSNNSLSNLQSISHQENLLRKSKQSNKYTDNRR